MLCVDFGGFWFCGFCFESLVLGLVLAWITSFRFWFESLILGLLVADDYKVLGLCTDMLMLMPLFCWWVYGFCWWSMVSGLWMMVLGLWILLIVSRQWSFVVGFHSKFFFSLSKVVFFIFIFFFLSSSNLNQRKSEEEERDLGKGMSE